MMMMGVGVEIMEKDCGVFFLFFLNLAVGKDKRSFLGV